MKKWLLEAAADGSEDLKFTWRVWRIIRCDSEDPLSANSSDVESDTSDNDD